MGKEKQAVLLKPVEVKKVEQSLSEKLKERRSKEIIIAFCGPVGSRISDIVDKAEEILKAHYKYDVIRIKISNLIKKHAQKVDPTFEEKELSDPADRYLKLQAIGNELRKKYGNEILGQLAIESISIDRQKRKELEKRKRGEEGEDKHTYRVAYLIDSLKHPDEVSILRAVYRSMFFYLAFFVHWKCEGKI